MYYATPPRTPARLAAGFIASQSYRTRQGTKNARSYTKSQVRYRKPYAKSSSLKKYILGTQPAKHLPLSDIQVSGTHNTLYSISPTQTISQGTGNNGRIGDSVHLLSLKISGWVSTNASITKATEFRIVTLWSGEEYACPTALTTPALTTTDLFVTSTTPGWVPNSIFNPKAVTVLDDRTITLTNSITNVADLESFSYSVGLNCDHDYQASGSTYGKTRNLYVVVMGAVLDGTTGSTVWGVTNLSMDLVFK